MLTLQDYAIMLSKAVKTPQTIMLSCHCAVHYSGRAESFLDYGDRVIIIKEDNTLLVHQPKGSNPVNYMKENTSYDVSLDKGILTLKARNTALKEFMDIAIKDIYSMHYRKLSDAKSIIVEGTEEDMANMIFEHPELIEPGFKPLSREEHTQFGFIDVFGYDKDNILVVVECKRYVADFKAVEQLNRYVQKIMSSKGLAKVRGILAAPKITPGAQEMLTSFNFEFKAISPPNHLQRFNKSQKSLSENSWA